VGTVGLLLFVEFVDEIVFGPREAAWPAIRDDLNLSYAEIGLLLGLPGVFADLLEMPIYLLGDTWRRRSLLLGGAVAFTVAILATAFASSFWLLLFAFTLFGVASGAFVNLSQSALVDLDRARAEQNMARWTLAGSVGVVAGTLAVSATVEIEGSWRLLFLGIGVLVAGGLTAAIRVPIGHVPPTRWKTWAAW
jgi:MFS transporter, FSR family, fosmidomycin resistance protein